VRLVAGGGIPRQKLLYFAANLRIDAGQDRVAALTGG